MMRSSAHLEMPDLEMLGRDLTLLTGPEQERLREVREHLRTCASCSATAKMDDSLRRFAAEAALEQRSSCPGSESWLQLAARMLDEPEAAVLLSHAAGCAACSAELKTAREDLGGPDIDDDVAHLRSSTALWQGQMAHRLAAEVQPAPADARRLFRFPARPSWGVAIAAMLLVAVGTTGWRVYRQGSDDALLAQAYDRQRRTELRLPDGDAVPLASMNRGSSERGVPTELLRLRLRAQEHLDKNPNDAYWHAVLGRIALVENSGQVAKGEIDTALALDSQRKGLKRDLAAAYFEIGDAGGNPLSFARAADLYGQVIDDPATAASNRDRALAYFNRALCWDRQALPYAAIKDYERALDAEKDSRWRLEIQRRLDAARSLQKKSEVLPDATRDNSPESFLRRSAAGSAPPEEEYEVLLEVATRDWLPRRDGSSMVEAALRGLALLGASHQDLWMHDVLESRPPGISRHGAESLASALKSNAKGNADRALGDAEEAARMFGRAHATPGMLRAEVETIYTLQRQGKAEECLQRARPLLATGRLTRYAWLHAYLLLEVAACRAGAGDAEGFSRDTSAALAISRAATLPLQMLREEGFLVEGSDRLGDMDGAWRLAQQGLRECQARPAARMPAYQFLQSMYSAAVTQELRFTAAGIAEAASHAAGLVANVQIQAYAQEVSGRAQTEIGHSSEAGRSFEQASTLLKSLPAGPAARLYAANWEADRSEWLARGGRLPEALMHLKQAEPSILATDHYDVRQGHYTESARLLLLAGDSSAALTQLAPATSEAERALAVTVGEAQRLAWERSSGRGYRLLVAALAARGEADEALRAWEWYRAAPYRKPTAALSMMTGPRLGVLTLVVARVEDEYLVWSIDPDQGHLIRLVRLEQSPETIESVGNTLLELCARRDSSEPAIRALGRKLYTTLFGAFRDQIEHAESFQVDVDPHLQRVPFTALVQSDGRFVGLAHPIVFLPAWWSVRPAAEVRLQAQPRALLIEGRPAGALNQDGSSAILPAQYLETQYLQVRFPDAVVLRNSGATMPAITLLLPRADVLHFSGHTVEGRGGSALLLGGSSPVVDAAALGRLPVSHLRLAVLATCSSSGGEQAGINDVGSLAHALLVAGAGNVVATLWDVDTESSRELMVRLYDELRQPETIPAALRSAQQHVQAIPAMSHPFFWASAVVYAQ